MDERSTEWRSRVARTGCSWARDASGPSIARRGASYTDPARVGAIEAERRRFDARAEGVAPDPGVDLFATRDPRLRAQLERLALEGARMLELGGSGEPTRAFPARGVRRVDRVVQHVTFAEVLHHMDRSRVVPEVARVLRSDGTFMAIEPYHPSARSRLVALRRRLARADRGTDDPLGPRDLARLARPSALVRFAPLERATRRSIDPRTPEGAVRWIGGRVYVHATAPRR